MPAHLPSHPSSSLNPNSLDQSLLDQIPVGIFRDDRQGQCVYVNDRLSQLTGVSKEQMLGQGWISAVHPHDRDQVSQTWATFVQASPAQVGTELALEYRFLRPDNRVIWVLGRAVIEQDAAGAIVGFIGTVTDISDRKQIAADWEQSQANLKLSEERWRLILRGSNDGIWDWDIQSNTVIRSDQWAELLGYSEAEIQGERLLWINLLHPEDRDRVLQFQQDYLQRKIPTYAIEYRLRCKNGHYKWILSRGQAIWNEQGQAIRMAGSNTDIDQRKNAEAALRSSEEKFRELAEHIEEVFFINSADVRQLLYISPAYEKIWGRSVESIYQAPWSFIEAIHPDDRDRIFKELEKQAQGNEFHAEYRIQRPDGEIRWIFARSVPIRDETGRLLRHVGIAEDITARKVAEVELRQAKSAAEAANQAKSHFLAHMSHELRTPLNAILGFSQLLSRSDSLSPDHRKQLGIINRSGEHLLNLINDILEMSKIEAGKARFQPVIFTLRHLLSTLEEMFWLKARQKGLQLTFECDQNLPQQVLTDENKLRQILINLLGNAIKFTRQGKVILRVSFLDYRLQQNQILNSDILLTSDIASNQLLIVPETTGLLKFEVIDTGVGIHPSELELLFEPFVQAKCGHIAYEGTGLGLPICRQFVNLMGGSLTVSSSPGQGSSFIVELPIQVPEAISHQNDSPRQQIIGLAPEQPIYRVLVAEDHQASQDLIRHLLEIVGFQVRVARNGLEAIELWEKWTPDLIWMDMQMPILDGYQATLQIRQLENNLARRNPNWKRTKLIALTASAFEEQRSLALANGCDDFVRKPFHEHELLEKIAEHLGATYLYQKPHNSEKLSPTLLPSNFVLNAEALKVMPSTWISKLLEASTEINSRRVMALIQEIPPEHAPLAHALQTKLEDFDLEEILYLAQLAAAIAPP